MKKLLTIAVLLLLPSIALAQAGVSITQLNTPVNVFTDGGIVTTQGAAGGMPLSIQGAADGGLPVGVIDVGGTVQGTASGVPISIQGAKDGGLPVGVIDVGGTVQGTAAGVPVVVQGAADGGLPISIAGGATVQGTAAGVPVVVQGAADGGLPLGVVDKGGTVQGTQAGVPISIQGSADGGIAVSTAGTVQGTAAGVPVSIQGSADGGIAVSIAGTVQGTAAGVPVSIQGSADGGIAVSVAGSVTANPAILATTPFSAQAATGTHTSAADTLSGLYSTVQLDINPVAGTGSPSGCTIQLQSATGGGLMTNNGTAIPFTFGSEVESGMVNLTLALGQTAQYVFACAVYPTGSPTVTVKAIYSIPSQMADRSFGAAGVSNAAGALSVQGITSGVAIATTLAGGTVQGTAAGVPVVVQGAADGGLALNVALTSGPLSDGGIACSNATAANLNAAVQGATAGVPVSIQGSADGGIAVSVAGTATVQGVTSGVPISIQGSADGGISVSTLEPSTATIDAGMGTKATVMQGEVTTNGTTPTASAAGFTNVPAMNQDNRLRVDIGPANPIHYYKSTSSEALVVTAPATGTSFYVTDWTVSCGTTAQELQVVTCDAGTPTVWVDVYCGANGGATHAQVSPFRVVAGQSLCCDPVGGTTATCALDGFVAP